MGLFFLSLEVNGFCRFSGTMISGITLLQSSWLFLLAMRWLLQLSPSHPSSRQEEGKREGCTMQCIALYQESQSFSWIPLSRLCYVSWARTSSHSDSPTAREVEGRSFVFLVFMIGMARKEKHLMALCSLCINVHSLQLLLQSVWLEILRATAGLRYLECK